MKALVYVEFPSLVVLGMSVNKRTLMQDGDEGAAWRL